MAAVGFVFAIVLIALIIIFLISISIAKYQTPNFVKVKIGDAEVNAEIADTQIKQMRGLMFRESLEKDNGMLFVFDSESKHGIWMMNMSIPLDVIWMDKNKKVVHIEEGVKPCDALAVCQVYQPLQPAKYVLEVNSGYAKKHGIKFGTVANFKLN